MFLYYQNECLGKIEGVAVEGPWAYGKIIPNEKMENFKDFFRAVVDEDNPSAIEKFDDDLLDDDNWFIVDDEYKKVGISLPGIYEEDNEINWRWR
ncbi:hypothetical protein NNG64_08740 [Bacillus siamensis]|uniref:Group-specific protein n=1 Tax=Bacillus siamensis TaxID=659243 RepID=A0AAI8N0L3_9BACI|nr:MULTISPECIES: hypothetical protein [Bacillus]AME05200.1 hypothetical protein AUL54_02070 [Bacillus sp. SDLI1]AUJ77623.1 hypothetical protein CWD84_12755 [Bacillus siamensis]UUA85864.1 hypothetical protein NNG64_08740 [Bacillus siamensis]